MKKISIYLAGNVKKSSDDTFKDTSWRDRFKEILKERLKGIDARFLDPTELEKNIRDSYSIFARDIFFVTSCDFVVVEGKEKQGIGAGAEMVVAKLRNIPVITVVPKDSYYRMPAEHIIDKLSEREKNEWIHPFMLSFSDVIVENLDEAAKWIKEHVKEKKKIKDISVIKEAIGYYKKTHYDKDGHARNAFE